jgi:hypothetical protein
LNAARAARLQARRRAATVARACAQARAMRAKPAQIILAALGNR